MDESKGDTITYQFPSETLPARWVGKRGHLEWCPRSLDLTPLGFYGYDGMTSINPEIPQRSQNSKKAVLQIYRQTWARIEPLAENYSNSLLNSSSQLLFIMF